MWLILFAQLEREPSKRGSADIRKLTSASTIFLTMNVIAGLKDEDVVSKDGNLVCVRLIFVWKRIYSTLLLCHK